MPLVQLLLSQWDNWPWVILWGEWLAVMEIWRMNHEELSESAGQSQTGQALEGWQMLCVLWWQNLFGTEHGVRGVEEPHVILILDKRRVCARHKHRTPRVPSWLWGHSLKEVRAYQGQSLEHLFINLDGQWEPAGSSLPGQGSCWHWDISPKHNDIRKGRGQIYTPVQWWEKQRSLHGKASSGSPDRHSSKPSRPSKINSRKLSPPKWNHN